MREIKAFMQTILLAMFIWMMHSPAVFAYPEPVAVITNYDEVADQIYVERASGACEDSYAILYPGDQIRGDIDQIHLEFGPYASYSTGDGYYVVTYDPPSAFAQLWGNFQSLFAGLWQSVEDIRMGVSRGPITELKIYPLQGNHVTILPNQSVCFSWEIAKYKLLVIKDEKGKIVFKKNVERLMGMDLIPRDAGLQMSHEYQWTLDGDNTEHKFIVLGKDEEKILMERMAEIDAENISEESKCIKQAAYLQLLSDTYPMQLNLYWLSYKILSRVQMEQPENIRMRDVLLLKCKQQTGRTVR